MYGLPYNQSDMRIYRFTLFAAVVALSAIVLTACGGSAPSASDGQVKLETPDLTIDTYQGADVLGGQEVKLSDLVAQGKPVVLNFYAALCPPCRAEMPDFQKVYDERKDEFTLVGVDIGPQQFLGSRDEGKALLDELHITYPAGTTFEDGVVGDFLVVAMPTTLFIRADGSLAKQWSGLLPEAKMRELIDDITSS